MSDGSSESRVLSPASTAEVVELVRNAVATGSKLRVRSQSTAQDTSAAEAHDVDLRQMNALVDYPARDMTITVQAGMTVSELSEILAAEGQQLPVDAPDPSMSVGAFVASDHAGPRQYGYGTLRDYLIGIEAVDGQGRTFHAGGRVVKNVAGYDLCRLLVGSRGSLGILTQLTFKLKPIPEHSILRCFRFNDSSAFEAALDRLNLSAATPVMLDFVFASAEQAQQQRTNDSRQNLLPYSLQLGVEGTPAVCTWQIEQLRNDCTGGEEMQTDGAPEWSIAGYCRESGQSRLADEVRIRTLPSKLVTVASDLAQCGYSSQGHAGNGLLFVDGNTTLVRETCQKIVAAHGGHVSDWDVDHPAAATDPLSMRIRTAFDPHSIFVT